jgi:hypothetical protein
VNDSNFELIMRFVEKRRIEKQPIYRIGLAGSSLSPDCGRRLCDLLSVLRCIDTDHEAPLIIELSQVPVA